VWRSRSDGRPALLGALALALALPAAVGATTAPPGNDPFAAPKGISHLSGSSGGKTFNATKEAGEPAHAGDAGGASIWYLWKAPATGIEALTTAGSSFDTLLAVYTGLDSLVPVAANDDENGSVRTSAVSFAVTKGTQYRIAVDGFLHRSTGTVEQGKVVLTWSGTSPPPNDAFAAARTLSGAAGSLSQATAGATTEAGEPAHAGDAGGASVWFTWTAAADGVASFSTAGSDFDTLLAVYTGTSVAALTPADADDDVSDSDKTSRVTLVATSGTTYRIAADGWRGASGTLSLAWTAAAPGDPQFLVAGNIGTCLRNDDEATGRILDDYPAATVATLGDNAYENGSAADFRCYDAAWGRAKARTRPAIGNHDYQTPAASGYFGYFGAAAGDPTKGYYSYDLGAWHVVVLNSECEQVGGCGEGSEQERWLLADLAAHPAACTLAYFHEPLFTSGEVGTNPGMKAFWEDLYAAGADVVLSAHNHVYERFAPQTPDGAADPARGITEFVVGTGGYGHHDFAWTAPNSLVRNNDTFGVLRLTLHPGGYDWKFLPVAGKTFTDSGSAACH